MERYSVLHKLGFGDHSTTWLARDEIGLCYRALKVLSADESTKSTELRMLQQLAAIRSDDRGKRAIRLPKTYFRFEGPNGQHICLLNEVAYASLQGLYTIEGCNFTPGARRLRADIARKVIRQVTEAVNFLHSHRVCHGGK